jgi:plastocyanin
VLRIFGLAFLLAVIFLVNCAPRVHLGPAYIAYPENRPIEIELRSFSFSPNHIAVLKNRSPFTLRLVNTSDRWHNFTLVDPNKNIVVKKDLKPEESTTFTIKALEPGNYLFYCGRFLCRLFGMKGMLMVQ